MGPKTAERRASQRLHRSTNSQAAGATASAGITESEAARHRRGYQSEWLTLGPPSGWILYPRPQNLPEAERAELRRLVVAFIRVHD
jgi:hypothetical protein